MTKEELEKEAGEYLEKEHCKNVCTCDEIKECKEGVRIRCTSFDYRKELIVNFAEPREKLIEELEAQIERMKCCVNCKHSRTEYEHCKTDKHEKWEIKEK